MYVLYVLYWIMYMAGFKNLRFVRLLARRMIEMFAPCLPLYRHGRKHLCRYLCRRMVVSVFCPMICRAL